MVEGRYRWSFWERAGRVLGIDVDYIVVELRL